MTSKDSSKKIIREIRRYYWDEPYLKNHCSYGIYRRNIAELKVPGVLFHYHSSDYAGNSPHSRKCLKFYKQLSCGLQCFRMLNKSQYNACQRKGKISKRHDMQNNYILKVEAFNCGIFISWALSPLFMGTSTSLLLAITYPSG